MCFGFQFPSNGKADRKDIERELREATVAGFNSLQTGKRIASRERIELLWNDESVSIPFKRESGSQVAKSLYICVCSGVRSFQFPSNGKADRKQLAIGILLDATRFNSLQTGKRIASTYASSHVSAVFAVSIPFKRESGSQALFATVVAKSEWVSIPFKRESGSQVNMTYSLCVSGLVSIPFKRESGSQEPPF